MVGIGRVEKRDEETREQVALSNNLNLDFNLFFDCETFETLSHHMVCFPNPVYVFEMDLSSAIVYDQVESAPDDVLPTG